MKKLLLLPLLSIFMIPSGIFGSDKYTRFIRTDKYGWLQTNMDRDLVKAVEKGNLNAVKESIEGGANINSDEGDGGQNYTSGATPLILAAQNGYVDVVIYSKVL